MKECINSENNDRRTLTIGLIYACLVFFVGAIINYTEPFDANPDVTPNPVHIVLWILLFLPIFFIPLIFHWKMSSLGFSITPILALITLALILPCSIITTEKSVSLYGVFSEAVARAGEEFFFRGYIYLLVIKLLNNNKRSWIWAIIISSMFFALIHTQTFQNTYFKSGSESVIFFIIQRILNVFVVGIALGMLRHFSNSILPGSIIHAILTGGAFTVPFVLIIYGIPVLFDFFRNNKKIIRL